MSYSYEYDESGLASSYLALSFLIPITLVYIYICFTRKQQKVLECRACVKSHHSSIFPKLMLFLLFCLIAFFVNNIRTIKMDIKKDFDPLEVLGVSLDASKKVIKRKMQTLLMKYAVHKAPEDKKEEYKKICMDISKAYVIMKNKDSFNTWLNTESKSGEIMAIPDVIMKNAFIAFLVYCVILGVALPFYTYKKWKIMRNKNRLGVNFKSMERFLDYFNEDMRKRGGDPRSLMWVLSQSVEFNVPSSKDMSGLKDKAGEEFAYPLPDLKTVNDGYFILYDVLFRTEFAPKHERTRILRDSLALIECMKFIAFNKGFIDVLKGIYTFQAMVVQSVFDEEFYLLQFPFIEFKELFLLKIKKGGKLQPNEILNCLLDEQRRKTVEKLREAIPKIKVEEFVAAVKNTGVVSENASDVEDNEDELVMLDKEAEGKKSSSTPSFNIPKNSMITIKIRLSSTNSDLAVHSHFVDRPLEHSWTAFISIDNVLHKKFIKVSKSHEEISYELESPSNKKVSEVRLFLLDGFYLKNNLEESILIKYV